MSSITYPSRKAPSLIGISLLTLLLSLVFGLLASSGNTIFVFLGVGLLGGVFMVAHPTMLLWISLIWTLVIAGVLRYFADIGQADWPVYAAAATFWLIAVASAFSAKKTAGIRQGSGLPGFLVALILFYVLVLANSLYHFDGLAQLLVGIKNYLLFFGLTLAIMAAVFPVKTLNQVALGVLLIALVQLPFTLYQYIFIRANRIATGGMTIGDSLVEASDSVVGTLGGQMLRGGLDDVLALLAFIVLAGVLAAWRQGLLRPQSVLMLTIILIVPVLLAETKIIFFYFPIVLLVVSWDYLRRRPHAVVLTLLMMPLVLAAGLAGYYHLHWSKQYSSIEDAVEQNFTYSFAEHTGIERARLGDMSRREAVEYWWDKHGLDRPDTLLFGHGLASSKLYSVVVLPKTVREHGGRNLAKTGLSQLLWDTGLVGTLLFFGVLLAAAQRAGQLARVGEALDRTILKAIQTSLLLMALSLLYRSSLLSSAQAGFLLFLMLGMVAYYGRLAETKVYGSLQFKG